MFEKILIANRGEIACRIIKTSKAMGIKTVAVFSDADRNALHVQMADETVYIGSSPSKDSYLSIKKMVDACKVSGADAVHPGYGFLSENPEFCLALQDADVTFIGPPASAIESMGDKITSKKIATRAGVSTVPGFLGLVESSEQAIKIADEIGYPVMIKASAGGGGKGMRIAHGPQDVRQGFSSSRSEAQKSFGDDRIFVEKFITQPRHIEIQVLGDMFGNYVYFGERECSIQRRNQKIIEEAPSPFLKDDTRVKMGEEAISLARSVGYFSAGTVEFIIDAEQKFYFLEMNTRLQVEHPVTELVYGVDLVKEMINIADKQKISHKQKDIRINGWAVESRIYAEDPLRNFLPSIGRLTRYSPPVEVEDVDVIVRNDTGVFEGAEISIYYDPMIAKLCVWAANRSKALEVMREALDCFDISGVENNLVFLSTVMDNRKFISGDFSTAFIEEEFAAGFDYLTPDEKLMNYFAIIATCVDEMVSFRKIIYQENAREGLQNLTERVVAIGNKEINLTFKRITDESFLFKLAKETNLPVEITWAPGRRQIQVIVDGTRINTKISLENNRFTFKYRGYFVRACVYKPREAELSRLMIDRPPEDVSKFILCPMPGLLTGLEISVGDNVSLGQALCTIEAMKMENVLRAEKNNVVKSINARVGDSLAVNDVIVEFE